MKHFKSSTARLYRVIGHYIRSRRVPLMVLAVILLIGAGAVFWRTYIYDQPGRAWQDMLTSSVATSSLTLDSKQTSGSNTREQVIQFVTGPNTNQARATTTIHQGKDSVVVENLATFDADYTRYTKIAVAGKKYDSVLNVWAKDDHTNQATSSAPQLLPDTVLRLGAGFGIPFGNVPLTQQAALLKQLRNDVLDVNVTKATTKVVNGQAAYVYTATIKPVAYATYVKAFATALGFTQLANYDATQAKAQTNVVVTLAVSRQDHRLIDLQYPALPGYEESYRGYNQAFAKLVLPTKTITYTELQSRLAQN